jgi:chemotaxis response regulator CheB
MGTGLTKAKTMTGRRPSQAGQARPQPNERASPKRASVDFPVVALGASAGGLDAFKKFFDALPTNSGMAFVLIQHLDPTHESLMVDLLAGHTPMKVLQATDGMLLARDHVYLIPPGPTWQLRAAPSASPSPWNATARACPSTSFCGRWPKNAVSAPSARSSQAPALTAVSD